ncbi:MAG TPA: DUF4838 domain-containing protein [Tepidisphaeraceae bacterium]|jgi:hypothetical protein
MRPLTILLALSLLAHGVSAGPLELVKDGKTPFHLVLPKDASDSQKYGADELKKHIKEMTGAELKIVTDDQPAQPHEIVIGSNRRSNELGLKPDLKSLGTDGFTLKTTGNKIFIVGSPVRGSMYGCFELLERLGVRWYTSEVTVAPKRADITVEEIDITQTPAFEYREPYMTEAWDSAWATHNRVVGHTPVTVGGQFRYADFVHSFDRLVPPALYDKHPEYFPMIEGKRINGYVQRCLSNPDVLKLVVDGVKAAFKANSNAVITTVSQNDVEKYCKCPDCSRLEAQYGTQSGVYLSFVNKVAQAIEKDYPDKLIDTLAYQFTEEPPRNIKPRHNVRIRLCPIYCCEAHDYEKCTYEANPKFVKRLAAWNDVAQTLYIWHYSTNFNHYMMPFPDFKQFPTSARLYKRSGVVGVFFQGSYCGPGGSDAQLRAYVMSKLLWNVNVDTDALVTDWMKGVYGPAWQPMRAWFDHVHETLSPADAELHCYDTDAINRLSTPAVLAKGDELFAQAQKLAQTELQKQYVKKASLQIQYLHLYHKHDPGDRLKKFVADAKSLGVTNTSESKSIDQWEKEYRAQPATK